MSFPRKSKMLVNTWYNQRSVNIGILLREVHNWRHAINWSWAADSKTGLTQIEKYCNGVACLSIDVIPFTGNLLLVFLRDSRSDIKSISWYAQTFPRRCRIKSECTSSWFESHNQFLDNIPSKSSQTKWGNVFFLPHKNVPWFTFPFSQITRCMKIPSALCGQNRKKDCFFLWLRVKALLNGKWILQVLYRMHYSRPALG